MTSPPHHRIPNLLSLPRGNTGRGRGRPGPHQTPTQRHDAAIQQTDTDASVSRFSAVSAGYLDDGYACHFVNGPGTRRLPIINRGTYARTTAVDTLVAAFLKPPLNAPQTRKQIISLGAGTDTRYLLLRSHHSTTHLTYHEIDFPSVCTSKAHTLTTKNLLPLTQTPCTPESPISSWQFGGGSYYMHPRDLRALPSVPSLSSLPGLRGDMPTLIISECCLCYLKTDVARGVIEWFGARIPVLGIVLYEPVGVDDAFGRMMVENLAARGVVMPTLQRYRGLEDQRSRLREAGFGVGEGDGATGDVQAVTIEDVWDRWVNGAERERVDSLEGLDELEEWQMLARHYAVVWGWRGVGWDGWEAFGNGPPIGDSSTPKLG